MNKKYILILFPLFSFLSFNIISQVSAAQGSSYYYDKGRDYGTQVILDSGYPDTYNGWSTAVISTQAYLSGTTGYERLRMWGRLDTLNTMYPYRSIWIQAAEMDLLSIDSRDKYAFKIQNTDPLPTTSPSTDHEIYYDIFDYFLPGGSIIGKLQTAISGATKDNLTLQFPDNNYSYWGKITINSPSNANLSNNDYSWYEADKSNTGASVEVYFNLLGSLTSYQVEAKGRILYGIYNYNDEFANIVYNWTNRPTVDHTLR